MKPAKKQVAPVRCAYCGHLERDHASEIIPGGLPLAGGRPCLCGRCESFVAPALPGARGAR